MNVRQEATRQRARGYQLQLEQLENRNLPAAPTNIVLIVTDDQRFDSLDYMPLTQELFTGGTRIDNAFVTTPVCCPSRASILTGEYARHHGVRTNDGGNRLDEENTLATWLDDEGYLTFFAGKYLNGYNGKRVPPGWDRWYAFENNRLRGILGGGYYRYTLNENGKLRHYGQNPGDYSTDVLRDKAVEMIAETAEAVDDQPFFLTFFPRAPHGPAIPARRHLNEPVDVDYAISYNEAKVSDKPNVVRRENRWGPNKQAAKQHLHQKQVRTLMAVDEAVAAIYDAVVDAGELSQTLFIYTSDNGFLWGEHRLNGKGQPYEESIRVPLLVRQGWADTVPALQQLVLNIDLAPTILDYAGVAIPESVDGKSLRPLLTGAKPAWRRDFLIEAWGPQWVGIRGVDFVYIVHATDSEEYYNLATDPFQMQNVIDMHAYFVDIQDARARLAELVEEIDNRFFDNRF